ACRPPLAGTARGVAAPGHGARRGPRRAAQGRPFGVEQRGGGAHEAPVGQEHRARDPAVPAGAPPGLHVQAGHTPGGRAGHPSEAVGVERRRGPAGDEVRGAPGPRGAELRHELLHREAAPGRVRPGLPEAGGRPRDEAPQALQAGQDHRGVVPDQGPGARHIPLHRGGRRQLPLQHVDPPAHHLRREPGLRPPRLRGHTPLAAEGEAQDDRPRRRERLPPPDGPARDSARALGYGSLGDIEERFRGNDRARIYDRDGNLAGVSDVGPDTDDDEVLEAAELEVPDGETVELRLKSGRKLGGRGWRNATLLPDGTRAYPSLRAMLPFEDEEEGDGNIVVPYLHVDGTRMSDQMLVLESARTLLEDNVIVAVGIEHSPDLDPRALIQFFREDRQPLRRGPLGRARPPLRKAGGGSALRRLFINLGLVPGDELRISGGGGASPEGARRRETPPFFVAMPRGRRNREEMTIQHMYDLFGGYGGGGGQIKTANDRKAPGK
ncbi:hypothetical protein THAOC_06382, partial [Thalassiosira oceanica]